MLDLCRLIFGMVIDLLRSRVALEAEILVLRQQINVLRRTRPRRPLSLSQTPSGWRLIENRAMLLLDVRFVQTDLWNGDRPAAVASCA